MAAKDPEPGYSLVDVAVGDPPWSPWLRLAHVMGYPQGEIGVLRRLRDWEMVLHLSGDAWIWWERLQASQPLPAGTLLLIPPGEVHAQSQNRASEHLAVHFDLQAQTDLDAGQMIDRLGERRLRADGLQQLCWRLNSGRCKTLQSRPIGTLSTSAEVHRR